MSWLLKAFKRFVIGALVIALIWFGGLLYYVSLMPTEVQMSEEKVDAAIVLTGGSKRVQHGFVRVATGLADRVFISGVNDESTPASIVALVRKSVADISNNRIALGYHARSTIGNAEEVSRWIAKNEVKTIRLITANYHMPRSLSELEQVLPESVVVIPDPVFPDGFDISSWLSDSNSRRLVMSEYHKFIAGHIRHLILKL